jgi:hypothetical protein
VRSTLAADSRQAASTLCVCQLSQLSLRRNAGDRRPRSCGPACRRQPNASTNTRPRARACVRAGARDRARARDRAGAGARAAGVAPCIVAGGDGSIIAIIVFRVAMGSTSRAGGSDPAAGATPVHTAGSAGAARPAPAPAREHVREPSRCPYHPYPYGGGRKGLRRTCHHRDRTTAIHESREGLMPAACPALPCPALQPDRSHSASLRLGWLIVSEDYSGTTHSTGVDEGVCFTVDDDQLSYRVS